MAHTHFKHTAHQREAGMTLVELLAVLAILAGLMVIASVSTATTRSRVRAEKTAKSGLAIIDALNRSEGLSFVSDMGRPPVDSDELSLLFVRQDTAEAYSYRELATTFLTNNVPRYVINAFTWPKLGAGWRGPYCDPAARSDGFGGEWIFDGTSLVSYGRNQEPDDDSDTSVDWLDRDQTFTFDAQHLTRDVELLVNASCASTNAVSKMHVYYFAPQLVNGTVAIAAQYHCATNSPSFSFTSGLSAGKRVVFVYAEANGEAFAAAPRILHLHPGNNTLDITLFRKSDLNDG